MRFNPELISQAPTHFDHEKQRKVKVFITTKSFNYHTGEPSYTAEIMQGDGKGMWTTVLEKNLEALC